MESTQLASPGSGMIDMAVYGADGGAWPRMHALLVAAASAEDDAHEALFETLLGLLEACSIVALVGHPRDGRLLGGGSRDGAAALDATSRLDEAWLARAFAEARSATWRHVGPDGAVVTSVAVPIRRGDEPVVGMLLASGSVALREASRLELLVAAAELLVPAMMRARLASTRPSARAAPEPQGTLSLDTLLSGASMRAVRGELSAAAHTRLPVLVLGESGSGKTALATAIAQASGRGPVVRAMLGASDDVNTIASELFGHERGAFSGAVSRRTGLVEHANGGTLILDEVLNLPMHAQQLLLDFTQFGTYRPLGHAGREPRRASVRLIAATNGDLRAAVASGRFRLDLYHRLAGIVVRMPSLRERRTEIPALASALLTRVDPSLALSRASLRALSAAELDWPGNVRELEAVLARGVARALVEDREARVIEPRHLGLEASELEEVPRAAPVREVRGAGSLKSRWAELQLQRAAIEARERAVLDAAMQLHRGVLARVAKEVGIARTTLIGRLGRTRRGTDMAASGEHRIDDEER